MDPDSSVKVLPRRNLVQRIPNEILSIIFDFCVQISESSAEPLLRSAPLLLGWINHTWRVVALSTPRLWANVHIYLICPSHPNLNAAALQTWLERSGFTPLHVDIRNRIHEENSRDVNEAICLLVPHAFRWETLHCELHKPDAQRLLLGATSGGLPLLEQLDLYCLESPRTYTYPEIPDMNDVPTLPLSLCPKLTFVDFGSSAQLIGSTSDSPYSLEMVKGSLNASLASCFHLIQNSPLLETLSVRCIIEAPFHGPDTPFTHDSITRLVVSLDADDPGVSQFLNSLTLPSLEVFKLLNYAMSSDPWSESLQRFLHRSDCRLEYLKLQSENLVQQVYCLILNPELRRWKTSLVMTRELLDILTCRYPPTQNDQVDADVVPKLEKISILFSLSHPASNLTDMVVSRWGGPNGRFPGEGRLTCIKIFLPDGGVVGDMMTPAFEQCVREGLERRKMIPTNLMNRFLLLPCNFISNTHDWFSKSPKAHGDTGAARCHANATVPPPSRICVNLSLLPASLIHCTRHRSYES